MHRQLTVAMVRFPMVDLEGTARSRSSSRLQNHSDATNAIRSRDPVISRTVLFKTCISRWSAIYQHRSGSLWLFSFFRAEKLTSSPIHPRNGTGASASAAHATCRTGHKPTPGLLNRPQGVKIMLNVTNDLGRAHCHVVHVTFT